MSTLIQDLCKLTSIAQIVPNFPLPVITSLSPYGRAVLSGNVTRPHFIFFAMCNTRVSKSSFPPLSSPPSSYSCHCSPGLVDVGDLLHTVDGVSVRGLEISSVVQKIIGKFFVLWKRPIFLQRQLWLRLSCAKKSSSAVN